MRQESPNAVKVARPTVFGNPFQIGIDAEDAAHAVALFEQWLAYDSPDCLDPYGTAEYRKHMSDRRERILDGLAGLAGRDLYCWCELPAPGEPDVCHAAVLMRAAVEVAGAVRV